MPFLEENLYTGTVRSAARAALDPLCSQHHSAWSEEHVLSNSARGLHRLNSD